jgi:hypothetical protein
MGSLLGFDMLMIVVFPIGSFLGVVFTIIIYSYTQHGKIAVLIGRVITLTRREILIIVLHAIPLYLFFLKIETLFLWLNSLKKIRLCGCLDN